MRYQNEVVAAGLAQDPYAIQEWTESPDLIPDVKWSDMMLYMIATPSQYTKEEIKVIHFLILPVCFIKNWLYNRHGKECLMVIISLKQGGSML